MGNSVFTQIQNKLSPRQYQWEILSSNSYSARLRDKQTGLLGERHHIELKQIEDDSQLYLIRHRHNQYLVDVYSISQDNPSGLCNSNKEISIIVQYIPYRLADLGSISLEEGLYILSCVLRASEQLKYSQIQFYEPDQTNICFNSQGECKYWIHQVLYRGKPSSARILSEREFLINLWELVEQRVNEVNSFFDMNISILQDLTVESVKRMVDRSLSVKLVSLPSINHMKQEQNHGNIFLQQCQLGSHYKQENKKVSLSSYNSRYKLQDEHSKNRKDNNSDLSAMISTPKKSKSNREKNVEDNFSKPPRSQIIRRLSINDFSPKPRYSDPFAPFVQIPMMSPLRPSMQSSDFNLHKKRQRNKNQKETPRLNFSYNSPKQRRD